MKRFNALGIMIMAAFFLAGSAHAAGYMKFDGVKGETTKAATEPAPAQRLDSPTEAQPAALLLPAVQKVQADDAGQDQGDEAARKKKGNVEYGWKVEEGTK